MFINAFWPGTTKTATCSNDYQQIGALFGGDSPNIMEDGRKADGVMIAVITYGADIAYGRTQPSVVGHPMPAGSDLSWTSREALNKMWVRNNAAGSNAGLIITPLFAS